jgi:single-stranded-DNA-specific exonuclease
VAEPEDIYALAMLGTVADGALLRGENRTLVRWGLESLGDTRHPGLRALLARSRPNGAGGPPDTELVSFYIAPRLNAPGRLGDAGPSLRLLMSTDPVEAEALAAQLDALNTERQRLAQLAWDAARKQLDTAALESRPLIAVRCDEVPTGLLGPLAGRLCEAYGRPALAMAMADGLIRASGRSVEGFDIHAAVVAQSHLLQRFGGHARAAGFTTRPEDVDAVLQGMEKLAAWSELGAHERPQVAADAEARLEELGVSMWEFVSLMAPFGEGNPAPVFISRGVQPTQVRTMGSTGRHLRMTVEDNGRALDAVGFGLGDAPLGAGRVDIAYGLRTNYWYGRARREIDLKAVRPAVS